MYSGCNAVYVSPSDGPPSLFFNIPIDNGHGLIVPLPLEPSSRRLLEVIKSPIALARYIALPKCETWVHESHTIALLGEAAHPNLVSVTSQPL